MEKFSPVKNILFAVLSTRERERKSLIFMENYLYTNVTLSTLVLCSLDLKYKCIAFTWSEGDSFTSRMEF